MPRELSQPTLIVDPISDERVARLAQWTRLQTLGGPLGLSPHTLRELGIYGGAQGVWVDKARTSKLTPDGVGVTVSVLHTGSTYADDLSTSGLLYYYPQTRRPRARDEAEIAATKAAGQLKLPVFVITYPRHVADTRHVFLGWVEGWDDEGKIFLITFDDQPPARINAEVDDTTPFVLVAPART